MDTLQTQITFHPALPITNVAARACLRISVVIRWLVSYILWGNSEIKDGQERTKEDVAQCQLGWW